jgi:hypothetical protein
MSEGMEVSKTEGRTPFSATDAEYQLFLEKQQTFSNSRIEDKPVFETMREDLPRFAASENGKTLIKTLVGA